MMETVEEEILEAAESIESHEQPEQVFRPAPREKPPEKRTATGLLKELASAVVEDLKDYIADNHGRVDRYGPELTLLNLRRDGHPFPKPANQCAACGSTKIIRNARTDGRIFLPQGDSPGGSDASPESYGAALLADFCGECGHLELKAEDPESFYNHWLRLKKTEIV